MARAKTLRFSYWLRNRRVRRVLPSLPVYNHEDLSDIEEEKDRSFFVAVGAQAAANAINENRAMNIPVTFMEDGWVVRRMPQGNIERIAKIDKPDFGRVRKLTKGTVLHVKRSR